LYTAYVKTFMTKMIVEGKNINQLIDASDIFRMEAHAYTKILPILGSFGPSCIHADQDIIIMEDLAEKGYANCERRNFLDLDHSIFTLKVRFLDNSRRIPEDILLILS